MSSLTTQLRAGHKSIVFRSAHSLDSRFTNTSALQRCPSSAFSRVVLHCKSRKLRDLEVSSLRGKGLNHNLRRGHLAQLLALVVLTRRFSGSLAWEEEECRSNRDWRQCAAPRSISMAAQALPEEMTAVDSRPRVAVIGGGLAGLAASVEVLRHGGSVVIFEKTDRLGGNSAKASSGINAALSAPQRRLGLEDSLPDFKDDTMRSGKGHASGELVDILVANSAAAVDFLQDFDINLSSIARLGGHSHARTHRAEFDGKAMNVGYRIMSALSHFIEGQPSDKVEVMKRASVTEILFNEEGQVRGVRCEIATKSDDGQEAKEAREVPIGAVVLATGGFCADKAGLLTQHVPALKDLATTNGPFATGDGVRLGVRAGAGLVDMDQVQLHPTAFLNPKDPTNPTKFLAPEALRGCGGVLLNQRGQRFVNELATRDAVVAAIVAHCDRLPPSGERIDGAAAAAAGPSSLPAGALPVVAYLVLNAAGIRAFDKTTTDFYISKGLIQKFENAAEMSRGLRLPVEAVRRTLLEYGHAGKEEHPEADRERQEGMHVPSEATPPLESEDPFGKPTFPNLFSPDEELYVALVTPALHYCMGGLRFDTEGKILREDGMPIGGLYGAGEVTGGVHGRNRLAGNSLLECVVFGRIAGTHAWEHAQHQQQNLNAAALI